MDNNWFKRIALLFSLTLLSACSEEAPVGERVTTTVSLFEVQQPVDTQYRHFKGTVVPADLTALSFRIQGELQNILVKSGQHVHRGELLAQMDDSKLRQQLADAQAQYQLALKQEQRGQELRDKQMISASELDELSANRKIAHVAYRVAENNLAYSQLIAPFDGFISAIPKETYESVAPGETVLTLYRDDVVRIRVGVSDSVLAMINPAIDRHAYQIKTTFFGDDREFTVNYYEHSSEPVEGGNAFALWLEMPQAEPPILPGSSANLDVDMLAVGLSQLQGYLVPMTAIDAGVQPGEFFVWRYSDGVVHRQPVDIIQVNSRGVIISHGLRQGDKVVVSKLKKLREDAAVTIVGKESML